MPIEMSAEEISAFLKTKALANVATLKKEGSPHVLPLWVDYDGRYFYLTILNGRSKLKHLRRDNRIALSIASETMPYKAVVVEGTAELTEQDVWEITERVSFKYGGPEMGEKYMRFFRKAGPRTIVKITPKTVRSWDNSKA